MIDGKITELLQTKGMEYDETSASWYGTVSGYGMKLVRTNDGKNYELVVPVTNGSMPDKQTMAELGKQINAVGRVTVKQYDVTFLLKDLLRQVLILKTFLLQFLLFLKLLEAQVLQAAVRQAEELTTSYSVWLVEKFYC